MKVHVHIPLASAAHGRRVEIFDNVTSVMKSDNWLTIHFRRGDTTTFNREAIIKFETSPEN